MSNKPEEVENNFKEAKSSVDLSRRRLTKAGLIAGPIFATLPGKSALAGNCTTLSGVLSGNLSAQGGDQLNQTCGFEHIYGCSHGYWCTAYIKNRHAFPQGYDKSSYCSDISPELYCPPDLAHYTLLEILNLPGNAHVDLNLTRQTIAAYFNSQNENYFFPPELVVDIYNSIITYGYYEVGYGERIYGDDSGGEDRNIIRIYEASYVDNECDQNNTLASKYDFIKDENDYIYFKKDGTTTTYYRYDSTGGYSEREHTGPGHSSSHP